MLILLADDDKLIRFSMKSLLTDHFAEDYRILEARNGKELVEQCLFHKPDLAFVDIDMPYMDGISAIAACRERSPHTQFVVLTGHNEFAYAQRCVSLGVVEYLLKPVDSHTLEPLLLRLEGQLANRLSTQNSLFQVRLGSLFRLLDETGQAAVSIGDQLLPAGHYFGFSLFLTAFSDQAQYARDFMQLQGGLEQFGMAFVDGQRRYALLDAQTAAARLVLLGGPQDRLDRLFAQLWATLHTVRGLRIVGMEDREVPLLYDQMSRSEQLGYGILTLPPGCSQLAQLEAAREAEPLLAGLWQLAESYAEGGCAHSRYLEQLAALGLAFGQQSPALDYQAVAGTLGEMLGVSLKADSCSRLLEQLCQLDFSHGQGQGAGGDKVEKICSYIQRSYMNDLSVAALAERFALTPNYLSTIFRDATGQRLTDYITDVRIQNAKRLLLRNRTAMVKDIALLVGYVSARHFGVVFRKVTGMQPSEYREQNSI